MIGRRSNKPGTRLRVLHVVPTYYPATYFGGPIVSLLGLCNALAGLSDIDLCVLTTDSSGPTRKARLDIPSAPVRAPEGYDIYYCRKWWGREFSGELLRRLYPLIRRSDVVHLTGVYSFPTIPTLVLCRWLQKPVVWSPRGSLQRWKGSTHTRLKSLWEGMCSRLLVPGRCVLHVTSAQEAEESRHRVACAAVRIVENGVDIPSQVPARTWKPARQLRLLFMGRLDPKKGIENLLHAMLQLEPTAVLTICGSGDPSYESALGQLADGLGLSGRVRFEGHVTGAAKLRAFTEADICVMPSYTENFGMVVSEALAHGVPVLASDRTPWAEVVERGCGRLSANDPDSLAQAVRAMAQQDLRQMGGIGRQWMTEAFSWDSVAARMDVIYRELAAGRVDA